MNALESVSDDIKEGVENRSKIDENLFEIAPKSILSETCSVKAAGDAFGSIWGLILEGCGDVLAAKSPPRRRPRKQ